MVRDLQPMTPIQEAARLWLARDEATDSPLVGLDELYALDSALEANLAQFAWQLSSSRNSPGTFASGTFASPETRLAPLDRAPLDHDETRHDETRLAPLDHEGALFAVAVHAFRTASERRIEAVLRDAGTSKARFREVESALGWVELTAPLRALLERWKTAKETMLRRLAVAGFAVHRVDLGDALAAAVCDADAVLRARAVRAVYQLGRRDLLPLLRYDDPDVPTRFSACWSGALISADPAAVAELRRFAETGERYPDRAAQLVCLCMPPDDARAWLRTIPPRWAILGAWSLADPADLPWLLDYCEQPPHARVAAEAIAAITGLRTPEAPATTAPIDPADALLVDPDLAALRKDVATLRLERGVRHQLGRPITPAVLQAHLRNARMRIRTLVATELALRTAAPSFEVRANAAHQRRWLAT